MDASRAGTRPGSRSGPGPAQGSGRTARVVAAERRIAAVARVLDDLVAIPGTRSRIGLDPIVGLVPFLGDIVTSVVAAWIVVEAARFRLPAVVIARMVLNALVDFAAGLVPVLGDLFDLAFKANRRNLELFHRHAVDPGASTSGSTALLLGVMALVAGVAWLVLALLSQLLAIEI